MGLDVKKVLDSVYNNVIEEGSEEAIENLENEIVEEGIEDPAFVEEGLKDLATGKGWTGTLGRKAYEARHGKQEKSSGSDKVETVRGKTYIKNRSKKQKAMALISDAKGKGKEAMAVAQAKADKLLGKVETAAGEAKVKGSELAKQGLSYAKQNPWKVGGGMAAGALAAGAGALALRKWMKNRKKKKSNVA